MINRLIKKCLHCKISDVTKHRQTSWADYQKKKYCSNLCYTQSRIGVKQSPETIAKRVASHPYLFDTKARKNMSKGQQGKKIPKKTRLKMSKTHRKRVEMGLMWNYTGKSSLMTAIRHSAQYRIWRESIFERDAYRCQQCGDKNRPGRGSSINLQADHIIPLAYLVHSNSVKSVSDAFKCEDVWDVSNGRTLCSSCHKSTQTFAMPLSKQIKHYTM